MRSITAQHLIWGKLVTHPGGPIHDRFEHQSCGHSRDFPSWVLDRSPSEMVGLGSGNPEYPAPWNAQGALAVRLRLRQDEAFVIAVRVWLREEQPGQPNTRLYKQSHILAIPADQWHYSLVVPLHQAIPYSPLTQKDFDLPPIPLQGIPEDSPLPPDWNQRVRTVLGFALSGHQVTIQDLQLTPERFLETMALCMAALPAPLANHLAFGSRLFQMTEDLVVGHCVRASTAAGIIDGSAVTARGLEPPGPRVQRYLDLLDRVPPSVTTYAALVEWMDAVLRFIPRDASPSSQPPRDWKTAASSFTLRLDEACRIRALEQALASEPDPATADPADPVNPAVPVGSDFQHQRPVVVDLLARHFPDSLRRFPAFFLPAWAADWEAHFRDPGPLETDAATLRWLTVPGSGWCRTEATHPHPIAWLAAQPWPQSALEPLLQILRLRLVDSRSDDALPGLIVTLSEDRGLIPAWRDTLAPELLAHAVALQSEPLLDTLASTQLGSHLLDPPVPDRTRLVAALAAVRQYPLPVPNLRVLLRWLIRNQAYAAFCHVLEGTLADPGAADFPSFAKEVLLDVDFAGATRSGLSQLQALAPQPASPTETRFLLMALWATESADAHAKILGPFDTSLALVFRLLATRSSIKSIELPGQIPAPALAALSFPTLPDDLSRHLLSRLAIATVNRPSWQDDTARLLIRFVHESPRPGPDEDRPLQLARTLFSNHPLADFPDLPNPTHLERAIVAQAMTQIGPLTVWQRVGPTTRTELYRLVLQQWPRSSPSSPQPPPAIQPDQAEILLQCLVVPAPTGVTDQLAHHLKECRWTGYEPWRLFLALDAIPSPREREFLEALSAKSLALLALRRRTRLPMVLLNTIGYEDLLELQELAPVFPRLLQPLLDHALEEGAGSFVQTVAIFSLLQLKSHAFAEERYRSENRGAFGTIRRLGGILGIGSGGEPCETYSELIRQCLAHLPESLRRHVFNTSADLRDSPRFKQLRKAGKAGSSE